VEAASEGCDLHTAEGRAHMASNAKPLWTQLPEGALKLQLLSELSSLVQISSTELSALWQPSPASAAPTSARGRQNHDGELQDGGYATSYGGYGKSYGKSYGKPYVKGSYRKGKYGSDHASMEPTDRGAMRRAPPSSRADHATRLLLAHSALWEGLSSEDHGLLCSLPAPHGPLIAWLEAQLHEHGPVTWSALQADLQGDSVQTWVSQLMVDASAQGQSDAEAASELRDLLNRMLLDRIKVQQDEAIAVLATDPDAKQRYNDLRLRHQQLVKQLEKSQTGAIMQG
jgi:DNA primase